MLVPHVLPHIAAQLASTDVALRQVAAFAAGILAETGGDAITPHCPALVAALVTMVTAPDARTRGNESATDNAVAALLRFVRHRGECIAADDVLSGCLEYLPVKEDAAEARNVHAWLVAALVHSDARWMGGGGARVPRLLSLLGAGLVQHAAAVAAQAASLAKDDGVEFEADPATGAPIALGHPTAPEEQEQSKALFFGDTLAALRSVAAALTAAGGPQAAAVAGVVRALPPNQCAALVAVGFPA